MPGLSFVLTATLAVMPGWAWTDPAVMDHLRKWEAEAKNVKTLAAGISLTRMDHLRKESKDSSGSIILRKPNQVRMRLQAQPTGGKQPDPNDYETYIWTGTKVYEYHGLHRTVTEFAIRPDGDVLAPKELGPLGRWLAKALLFERPMPIQLVGGAFSAEQLASRFSVKRIQDDDPNYIYLELKSRTAADKMDFDLITLALYGPEVPQPHQPYNVATVVVLTSNRLVEHRWDFLNLEFNPDLPPEYFAFEEPPANWKVLKAEESTRSKQPEVR